MPFRILKVFLSTEVGFYRQNNALSSTILVHVNTQPAALSTPWSVTTLPVGQQFSAALPTSFMVDADGDRLSCSLVRTNPEHLVPTWISLDNTTLFGTPLSNTHQPITIQLKGEDGFGGEAYRLVSLSIPNSAPVVHRELGVITAFAGDLKTYIVPRDAIKDADGDELAYSAFRKSQFEPGTTRLPLPGWAVHLSSINSFNLVPKSGDQGNYTFVLVATDTQGASVQTEFKVHVPNRVPELTTDYADETLTALERFSYSVGGHFSDVDGDTLSYEVSKPVWVHYEEGTKTLSGMPPQIVRSYGIDIAARDGHGGEARARLTVHVDPTSIQLSSVQLLQLFGYGSLAFGLLTISTLFMVHRNRQIKRAERGAQGIMRKWSTRRCSLVTGMTEDEGFTAITNSIDQLARWLRCLGMGTNKDELKARFQELERRIQGYYAQKIGPEAESITSMLLKTRFMDDLLTATELAVTEAWPLPLQRTLAGILHYSIRLLWVYHTGKGRLLSDKYKEETLTKLHDLCDEVSPRLFESLARIQLGRVEVYHRLLSAREAMLSIQDRSTWGDVAGHVLKKLLSPVGMFQILRDFWRNAPQGWYLKLVTLEQQIGSLDQSSPDKLRAQLQAIQTQAKQESHWAFRYGLVLLWQQLITVAGSDDRLATPLTQGTTKLLGLEQLKRDGKGCCKGKRIWVGRHAQTLFAELL